MDENLKPVQRAGKLPVTCDHCGGGPVRALRDAHRVLIRCERCRARIFTYWLDPARQHADEQEPPESEDLFFAYQVERALLRQLDQPTQALYEYIRRYRRRYGYAPTLREMQREMAWASPTSVRRHLEHLEEAGLIERDYAAARGIRLMCAG